MTNLAARLQSQAAAGEVTLSEEAYRRVQDWLTARETAVERIEIELKDFSGPVIAFRMGLRRRLFRVPKGYSKLPPKC